MRKIYLTLGMLITHDAMAQSCIPVPDCAAMGYTETSCSGNFLRCPFDTTKMACIGSQTSSSNCWVGYIYYTDRSCSPIYDSSKTVAGIVVKDNALVMSQPVTMKWASNTTTDVSGLTNITSTETALTDMGGRGNTMSIVSAYSSDTTSNNAGVYCNSYTGGISGTAGHWYLPAAGELYTYLFGNYSNLKPVASILSWSNFESTYFWSSSEDDGGSAWGVLSCGGSMYTTIKIGSHYSVSCLLAL